MLAYTWSAYLAATETDWLLQVGKYPKISTLEATHTSQAATFICDINLHSVHALLQRFGLFRTLQETQTWRHFSQQKKNKKKILLSHDFFPIKHTFHGSFPTRKQKRNNLENPGRPVMISFFSSSKNFPELREPCSNFFPLSLVCLFSRECHRETESWFFHKLHTSESTDGKNGLAATWWARKALQTCACVFVRDTCGDFATSLFSLSLSLCFGRGKCRREKLSHACCAL